MNSWNSSGKIFALIMVPIELVTLILFLTLGWTLDAGARLLDWFLPIALFGAFICLLVYDNHPKVMLIIMLVLTVVYFAVIRQSIMFR